MHPTSLCLLWLSLLSIGHKIWIRFTYLGKGLAALLPMFLTSLPLGAFIGLVLIPRRTIYLLLFVLASSATIYWINPHLRTYSNHGMIHLGYIFATERPPWPPEDPYLAGTPLCYPWVHHALVGRISSLLDVAPGWVIAGCNLAALVVTIVVVAKISRLLDGDVITANCAVVLAVLAPTVLGSEVGSILFTPLMPPGIGGPLLAAFYNVNALPPLEKYVNTSAMATGIAVNLIGLYYLLRVVKPSCAGDGSDPVPALARCMVVIVLSIIAVGYIYPFIWMSTCVVVIACVAVAAWAGEWSKVVALVTSFVLGNLVVLPYLVFLTNGRAPGSGMGLERDPRLWLARLLHVTIILLPLWLLIALRRRSLIERLREQSWAHWAALGSGLLLLLTFVLLHVRTAGTGVEYKFRTMAIFCLAPLAAPGLKRIYDGNKMALVLLLGLQLLPLCSDWYSRTPGGWGRVAEPYYWQGAVLQHAVPDEADLYQWIREHTPATAIVIDNKPYVPVYAQRSLLVARQPDSWKVEDWWSRRDGWLFYPSVWLDLVNGHPTEEIRRRNELADSLYGKAGAQFGGDLERQLEEMTDGRAVFVIARNARERAALESQRFLQRVAESAEWAVYALAKSQHKA
jgi:hypothetical protein